MLHLLPLKPRLRIKCPCIPTTSSITYSNLLRPITAQKTAMPSKRHKRASYLISRGLRRLGRLEPMIRCWLALWTTWLWIRRMPKPATIRRINAGRSTGRHRTSLKAVGYGNA